MPWRPKFNSIYQGEWPYKGHEGVGLKFRSQHQSFNVEECTFIFGIYGCHPRVASGILTRLLSGESMVTVSHSLDFDALAEELVGHGIMTEVIPPRPNYMPPQNQGEWPPEFLARCQAERDRRKTL